MEQGALDFRPDPIDLSYATVVMRWLPERNMLEASWPDFKLRSWFFNWQEALAVVLHPVNNHVHMRVRA